VQLIYRSHTAVGHFCLSVFPLRHSNADLWHSYVIWAGHDHDLSGIKKSSVNDKSHNQSFNATSIESENGFLGYYHSRNWLWPDDMLSMLSADLFLAVEVTD